MNGSFYPRYDPGDRLWPPYDPDDFIDLGEWEELRDWDKERYDRHLHDKLTPPPIRDVIVAEETEWGDEVDIGTWFECTPWDDPLLPPRISHTRVLYRDAKRFRPQRVVELWAPAGLVSADVLKDQDSEDARFIADKGWELVDEFVDRGESARTSDRPQFQLMLQRLGEEGSVRYLVVHKLDRLARNLEDHAGVRAMLSVTEMSCTPKIRLRVSWSKGFSLRSPSSTLRTSRRRSERVSIRRPPRADGPPSRALWLPQHPS